MTFYYNKFCFDERTSFLASSPLLILLGYLEMVDAAFLESKESKCLKY